MRKGDKLDPKGLIYESYRIDGIRIEECRSIFMDWALGVSIQDDPLVIIAKLLEQYGAGNEDHPMTQVLKAGLEKPTRQGRRGGSAARIAD